MFNEPIKAKDLAVMFFRCYSEEELEKEINTMLKNRPELPIYDMSYQYHYSEDMGPEHYMAVFYKS